jgi:hypothetical protein
MELYIIKVILYSILILAMSFAYITQAYHFDWKCTVIQCIYIKSIDLLPKVFCADDVCRHRLLMPRLLQQVEESMQYSNQLRPFSILLCKQQTNTDKIVDKLWRTCIYMHLLLTKMFLCIIHVYPAAEFNFKCL